MPNFSLPTLQYRCWILCQRSLLGCEHKEYCLLVLTNVKLPFRSKYFQQKARKRDLTSDHVSNYMGSISQNVLRIFSLPSLQMWEMFIKGNLLHVHCTYRGNDGPWNIHRTCFTGYIFIYLM